MKRTIIALSVLASFNASAITQLEEHERRLVRVEEKVITVGQQASAAEAQARNALSVGEQARDEAREIGSRVSQQNSKIMMIESDLRDLKNNGGASKSEVQQVDNKVTNVTNRTTSLENRTSALEQRYKEVNETLANNYVERENMKTRTENIANQTQRVEEDVFALKQKVESIGSVDLSGMATDGYVDGRIDNVNKLTDIKLSDAEAKTNKKLADQAQAHNNLVGEVNSIKSSQNDLNNQVSNVETGLQEANSKVDNLSTKVDYTNGRIDSVSKTVTEAQVAVDSAFKTGLKNTDDIANLGYKVGEVEGKANGAVNISTDALLKANEANQNINQVSSRVDHIESNTVSKSEYTKKMEALDDTDTMLFERVSSKVDQSVFDEATSNTNNRIDLITENIAVNEQSQNERNSQQDMAIGDIRNEARENKIVQETRDSTQDRRIDETSTKAEQAQQTASYAQSTAVGAYNIAVDTQYYVVGENEARKQEIRQVASDSKAYTNKKFSELKSTVDSNRKKAAAGIAGVAAQANIPQLSGGKNFSFGMGMGGYDGEQALSAGFNARITENIVTRASVSSTASGDTVYGAGASFEW